MSEKADGRAGEKSEALAADVTTGRTREDGVESWFNRKVKQPARAAYQKYFIEGVLRQRPLPASKDGRHIPLQATRDAPLDDERRGHAYISNTIRSSRYTIWDFVPKQLIFQATRLHNFYFVREKRREGRGQLLTMILNAPRSALGFRKLYQA